MRQGKWLVGSLDRLGGCAGKWVDFGRRYVAPVCGWGRDANNFGVSRFFLAGCPCRLKGAGHGADSKRA